eukprot:m.264105 g.264105  ORF g.264105 m.264105 type:complete len:515 (-) comp54655_c0_seq18:112-1656(-)
MRQPITGGAFRRQTPAAESTTPRSSAAPKQQNHQPKKPQQSHEHAAKAVAERTRDQYAQMYEQDKAVIVAEKLKALTKKPQKERPAQQSSSYEGDRVRAPHAKPQAKQQFHYDYNRSDTARAGSQDKPFAAKRAKLDTTNPAKGPVSAEEVHAEHDVSTHSTKHKTAPTGGPKAVQKPAHKEADKSDHKSTHKSGPKPVHKSSPAGKPGLSSVPKQAAVAPLPHQVVKNPDLVSSNWKQLQQKLPKSAAPRRDFAPSRPKPKPQPLQPTTTPSSAPPANKADDKWIDEDEDDDEHALRPAIKPAVLVTGTFQGATRYLAFKCALLHTGFKGQDRICVRVCIVNRFGQVLYESNVQPREHVSDERLARFGLKQQDLDEAPELSVVQQRVYDILKDHIVIGHQLTEDLKSLMLNFPKKKTCDIALYAPIQTLVLGSEREDDKLPSLRQISQILLGLELGAQDLQDTVKQTRLVMASFAKIRRQWEEAHRKYKQGDGPTKRRADDSDSETGDSEDDE